MVSVDEMIRIVKECQEIIRKAQDGNKNSATIQPPAKKEKKK
jgi:hypothetical protein